MNRQSTVKMTEMCMWTCCMRMVFGASESDMFSVKR